MDENLNINDKMENEEGMLNSIPKNNPFVVPQGFFETLPQSINKRIHQPIKPTLISVLFPAPVRVTLASIAALAVIFVGFLWFYNNEKNNIASYENDDMIEEYLVSYIDYNPAGLYQVVYDEDISEPNSTAEIDEDDDLFEFLVKYANYYMMSPEQFNGAE
jgi:hypothetical protein